MTPVTSADFPPSVRIPLHGPAPGMAGGYATIDAEDDELVVALGPWYRADLLISGERRPAARNRMAVGGSPVCAWAWLHNFVMGMPDKHVDPRADLEVCPTNGYWLDCRKSNLTVQPKMSSRR